MLCGVYLLCLVLNFGPLSIIPSTYWMMIGLLLIISRGVDMRKLKSLCRRLSRQQIGYFAVVKDGVHHYVVYEAVNHRMALSEAVFDARSVVDVEKFLLGRFRRYVYEG